MTTEHRIVVGLKDIKTLGYECSGCAGKVTFPIGSEVIPRNDCFVCHKQWQPQPGQQSSGWVSGEEVSAFLSLLKALNTIRTLEKQNVLGFKLIFEFDQTSASDREVSGRA